ncbi:MAG: hypothetical protein Q8S53_04745 [Brevundimonas sp.]|uniref:phage head spike fiber domain-containing protein n=1 Tax=Brevundimonas sp. TaxID=1871086 RepID=UPI002735415F|nr:hypothetical protein [Brevundimonas sp.]MDP3377651.1 hypothetical protein [Brevundimonas sp.]
MRLGLDLTLGGLALRQAGGAAPGIEPGIVLNLASDSHVWDGTPLAGLTALPGWTYSRMGNGWARRLDGTYAAFAEHVPRRTDMGLWSEPASTNLFARFAPSQAQLGGNANVTTVTEPATPPIVGLNWLALNNTGGAAYAYQPVTLAAATTYTMQMWVETPDGSPPVVGATSGTGDFCLLLGGAIVTGAVGMEALSGKVWRVWATAVTGGSPSVNSGVIRYAGQTTRALKFAGFQLETGALATSPMVSAGTVTTRGGDLARLTDLVTMGGVTLAAEFALHGGGSGVLANSRRAACLDDGTSVNRVEIGNPDGAVGGRVLSGGIEQARCVVAGTAASGAAQSAALRSRTDDFRLARNGILSDADMSGTAPGGLVRLTLGAGGDGTGQLGGCLTRLVLRPVAQSDAALLLLSS